MRTPRDTYGAPEGDTRRRMRRFFTALSVTAIALYSAGLWIYLACTPRFIDDLWFGLSMRDYILGGGEFPWSGLWETWSSHFVDDNARLSNIIFAPFLLLPKWVGSTIVLATWIASVATILRMCRISIRDTAAVVCTLALLTFSPAWYEPFISECYQFNYMLPSAVAIWIVSVCCRSRNGFSAIAALALGMLGGALHEGFGVPLACGLAAAMLLRSDMRTRTNGLILAGLALGTAWLALSPHFWARAASQSTEEVGLFKTLYYAATDWAVWTAAAIGAIRAIRLRSLEASPMAVILGVSALVSCMIQFAFNANPRAAWWGQVAAAILLARWIAPRLEGMAPGRKAIAASIAAMAMITYLTAIGICSLRMRGVVDDCISRYLQSDNGTFFCHIERQDDLAGLLSLRTPNIPSFYHSVFSVEQMAAFYSGSPRRYFIAVPEELRRVTAQSGEAVGHDGTIRRVGNYAISPVVSERPSLWRGHISIGPIDKPTEFIVFPFRSEADGRMYSLIMSNEMMRLRLGNWKISNVELTECTIGALFVYPGATD